MPYDVGEAAGVSPHLIPSPGCQKCLDAVNHARAHQECAPLLPLAVAVDATLMKLSEAKPGDVLVLRPYEGGQREAQRLAEALSKVRMPEGTAPIPIVISDFDVKWSIERK